MFSSAWSSRWLLAAFVLISFASNVFASVSYCSDLNTASTGKNSSIYQSNGLCQDFCKSKYAFAVVQNDGCWCSDYVPGTTTTGCTTTCPGYPIELCGGDSVFGYIALALSPSGTKGATSATSTAPATTAAPVTVTATAVSVAVSTAVSIATPDPSTSTAAAPTSTTPTTTSTPAKVETTSTTSPSSSTWTPTPVISLETVTGQVRTVTVTPTTPPTTSSQNVNGGVAKADTTSKGGISTGGAVGLTIGLVVLIGTIAAMIWYYLRKKKQESTTEDGYNDMSRNGSLSGVLGGPTPTRTMSENSRYVLGTNGRQVVEAWEHDQEPPGSRKSQQLRPVDQRLDPFAPPYRLGDNRSRDSVNTIRDDHDYSRRVQPSHPILRVNNPD